MSKTVTRPAKPEQPVRETLFRGGRAPVDAESFNVDPKGGKYGAGLMTGVSLIAAGEALGHRAWIDATTLSQVAEYAGKITEGVKARFTHPSLSADGTGRVLGRLHDVRVDGDRVIGDLHFNQSSHDTPDGDLAEYVMTLAAEDPKAAGLSIVFHHDMEAEDDFVAEHAEPFTAVDERGNEREGMRFKSPDPRNENNYYHVRIAELRAADVVDEPAANPEGLFDRQPFARQVDSLLSYAAGITSDKPQAGAFGVDGDRATQFLNRWLEANELSLTPKTPVLEPPAMADSNPTPTTEPAAPSVTRESLLAEQKRYTDKFGSDDGVKWFGEGKTYEESLELFCEKQSKQIVTLQTSLEESEAKFASLGLGEDEPVETGNGEADASESLFSKQFKTTPSRN